MASSHDVQRVACRLERYGNELDRYLGFFAMTGHVTKLPKGFKLKDGKLTKVAYFPNASAAIKAKKSKRARVVRRTAG